MNTIVIEVLEVKNDEVVRIETIILVDMEVTARALIGQVVAEGGTMGIKMKVLIQNRVVIIEIVAAHVQDQEVEPRIHLPLACGNPVKLRQIMAVNVATTLCIPHQHL